jgi:uncharacterized SAM-binding protein YcdF (DUF218 family)
MFVYVTKIFWMLFSPLSLSMLLVALGLVLSFTRWRRTTRVAIVVGLGLLTLCVVTNIGDVLIRPLETRFSRPTEPAHIDGIVVLGGGMDAAVTSAMGGWELNQSGDRFVEALRLALHHREAKVLVSGGVAVGSLGNEPEAVSGGRFFAAFGIAPDRLLLEDKSRNTEENAQFSEALAAPKPGETWLLVTSAFHMPRAMGLFRKAGFAVVPWPTDYFTGADAGFGLKLGNGMDNLQTINIAVREWVGLVGYWATGRIDSVLPGP